MLYSVKLLWRQKSIVFCLNKKTKPQGVKPYGFINDFITGNIILDNKTRITLGGKSGAKFGSKNPNRLSLSRPVLPPCLRLKPLF